MLKCTTYEPYPARYHTRYSCCCGREEARMYCAYGTRGAYCTAIITVVKNECRRVNVLLCIILKLKL